MTPRERAIALAGLLTLAILVGVGLRAQSSWQTYDWGVAAPPVSCMAGMTYLRTSGTFYVCTEPNVWRPVGWSDVNKNFANMPDNTFVDVMTITVPNADVAAFITVNLLGTLGPGGAIGEHESTTARQLLITVTRVQNSNADAAITVPASATDARVAGSTTISQGQQFSAWSGTSTTTQTIRLQYKVTKGGGASNNHQASIQATIIHHLGVAIGVS